MKKTGIWIDKKKAYIISQNSDGNQELKVVVSKIEDYRIHGGSGTVFKGGPQDVVQDSTYLEREKHQFKAYFKEIIQHLKKSDKILIFGPAEAGQKLRIELQKFYNDVFVKLRDVIKTDSMTENQMKAFVRDYFETAPTGIVD